VHPELSAQVPDFRAGLTSGGIKDGAEFAAGIESLTPTGKTNRPPFRDLLPEERHRYYGMVLRPNVFLDLHPDYVVVSRIEPLAPARTRIVSDLLFDPKVMARPDFDAGDAVEFTDLVSMQDADVCELSQLGATSRGFRCGGVYGPNERHIRDFDDYVLAMLGQAQQ
jgi:Rieske 2Fe-2S family protein